jgi:hypothetical protein
MANLQLLPKWIMKRYLILWKEFDTKEFEFGQALSVLQKMPKPDDRRIVGLFLSELRKAGWLEVNFDPVDTRKRIYRLKKYNEIFDEIVLSSLRPKSEINSGSERT